MWTDFIPGRMLIVAVISAPPDGRGLSPSQQYTLWQGADLSLLDKARHWSKDMLQLPRHRLKRTKRVSGCPYRPLSVPHCALTTFHTHSTYHLTFCCPPSKTPSSSLCTKKLLSPYFVIISSMARNFGSTNLPLLSSETPCVIYMLP